MNRPGFFILNTQRFGDYILSPFSGETYSGPIDRASPYFRTGTEIGTSSIEWAKLSRFHLKAETQFSLRNEVRFK
jgi:hypothetical protein